MPPTECIRNDLNMWKIQISNTFWNFSFHDLPLTLVWSYCSTFVLRANSWIWSLLALLSFKPHSYLIMTLTVRVTVKESWNQLEKCNSSTFHKDIHHCLSLFSVNRFLCAIANTDVSHYCVKPVPPNTLSHCRTPMKRSLYQLNFSFISVGVLITL